MTSGKIYARILAKERRGEYLGRDVQIVPHVTGEIKYLIRKKAQDGPYDMVLVEIGGTVGDIENVHFIEAARELIRDEGRDNVMYIHVTMVPWSEATGEQKSKPHPAQREEAARAGGTAGHHRVPVEEGSAE